MIRSPFILCLLALCLMAGSAGGSTPGSIVQQLEAPAAKADVAIRFPNGWTTIDRPGALLAGRAPQPDKDSTGQFQAYAVVVRQAIKGELDPAIYQQLVTKDYTAYRSVEQPTQFAINGLKGFYFGGTFTDKNIPLRTRFYIAAINNQVYIISFTTLASQWANYQQAMDASVATFSVKNK